MIFANKLVSLIFVVFVSESIEKDLFFVSVVLGAAFAHFWFGLASDFKYLKHIWKNLAGRLRLYFGVLGSVGVVAINQPLINVTFFAIHSAISDALVIFRPSEYRKNLKIICVRIAFETLLISLLFYRSFFVLAHWNETILFIGSATLIYAVFLFINRWKISKDLLINIIGLHSISALMIVLQYSVLKMSDFRSLFFVVLVHSSYWLFNPLFRSKFKPSAQESRLFWTVLICSIIFATLAVRTTYTFSWGYEILRVSFMFWFYFHLLTHLEVIRAKQSR